MNMPPVYCIYCEQLRERKLWAKAQHAKARLDVTMFQALHGKTWGLMEDGKQNQERGYRISGSGLALMMSHWMLWQHIWLAGHEEALILEDDCAFCDNFINEYKQTRSALPPDWDMLWVGDLGVGEPTRVPQVINSRIVRLSINPVGTHCYLVRRTALPIIMKNTQLPGTTDKQLYDSVLRDDKLRWYTACPSLADQMTNWKRADQWPSSID